MSMGRAEENGGFLQSTLLFQNTTSRVFELLCRVEKVSGDQEQTSMVLPEQQPIEFERIMDAFETIRPTGITEEGIWLSGSNLFRSGGNKELLGHEDANLLMALQ